MSAAPVWHEVRYTHPQHGPQAPAFATAVAALWYAQSLHARGIDAVVVPLSDGYLGCRRVL